MEYLEELIKQWYTFIAILHLKQWTISPYSHFSTVDSERFFSISNQVVEQLISLLVKKKRNYTIKKVQSLMDNSLELPEATIKDQTCYLTGGNNQLNKLTQQYTKTIDYFEKDHDLYAKGIMLSQLPQLLQLKKEWAAITMMQLSGSQRDVKERMNEPFDSEAVLNDL